MQNFKSAADLGIAEAQKDALMKTLVLLETGKMRHAESSPIPATQKKFSGQFNMANWTGVNECGTICCIGGTASIVGNVDFNHNGQLPPALENLFYVHPRPPGCDWHDITPSQAATALRSYLTTGDARWDLAVA